MEVDSVRQNRASEIGSERPLTQMSNELTTPKRKKIVTPLPEDKEIQEDHEEEEEE